MVDGSIRVDEQRLEEVMKDRKMTIGELAEKLGMHYNSVLYIKKRGTTNLGTLEELCNVLGCSPMDILVMEGYPEPFCPAPASP